MTELPPDITTSGGEGGQQADSGRRITLLKAEVRRLSIAITRQAEAAHADAAQAAREQGDLQARLGHVTGERDAILASRTWRLAQKLTYMAALVPKLGRRRAALPIVPSAPVSAPETADSGLAPATMADRYQRWIRDYGMLTDEDRTLIRARMASLAWRPRFSILIELDEKNKEWVEATRRSVQAQLYPYWDVCGELGQAQGDFVAFLPAGDLLAEQALYEIVEAIEVCPQAPMIFTDEDRIDDEGNRSAPSFKPAYNIDQLLGTDMVGGLAVYRRPLLNDELMGFSSASAYQRALAMHGQGPLSEIRHVPAVLYHRRWPPRVQTAAQVEIVSRFLCQRPELAGVRAVALPAAPDLRRIIWPLPTPLPRVSLIVPTRDRAELLSRCVAGLLHRTDYPDFELMILDNDSIEPWTWSLFDMLRLDPRVRVLPSPGPFNYSALNNQAVRAATGEIVVLLNNDVDVIDSGWLREMVSHAVRPDVGAVGAKLVFADERMQHAGVVLGVGPEAGSGIAGHFGYRAEVSDAGYLGQFAVTREVSAVTGACLALRREVYQAVGGLNETELAVAYNDVDLCLRIKRRGLRIIWTPFAELYHLESATRGGETTPEQQARAAEERRFMQEQWGDALAADPFFNGNFSRQDHAFILADPPRRRPPWR